MAELYNIKKDEYKRISKTHAIALVGKICKRLELLGELDTDDSTKARHFKALVKELIYENLREQDFAVDCLAKNLTKII